MIRKRFDKLTDYDSLSKKLECNKEPTRQRQLQEQQNLAKNVYEALNHQLLEELPKLCDLSMQILQDCIQAFLLARKQLIGRIAKHHLTLLELPLVVGFATGGSAADISETYKIKHNLITEQLLDEISILPPNVFPDCGHKTDISRRQSGRSSRKSLQLNNINISVANTRDIRPKANKNVTKFSNGFCSEVLIRCSSSVRCLSLGPRERTSTPVTISTSCTKRSNLTKRWMCTT